MTKQNNIFVKIQIEKNEQTGDLVLKIEFDKTAPNLFHQTDEISWYPTSEEIAFVNEAFALILKQKGKEIENTGNQEPLSFEAKTEASDTPVSSETPSHEKQQTITSSEMKADAAGIVMASDPKTVDEIIKKKQNGHGVMVAVDEETIVDRVLKQKKKNRW